MDFKDFKVGDLVRVVWDSDVPDCDEYRAPGDIGWVKELSETEYNGVWVIFPDRRRQWFTFLGTDELEKVEASDE